MTAETPQPMTSSDGANRLVGAVWTEHKRPHNMDRNAHLSIELRQRLDHYRAWPEDIADLLAFCHEPKWRLALVYRFGLEGESPRAKEELAELLEVPRPIAQNLVIQALDDIYVGLAAGCHRAQKLQTKVS